MKKFTPLVSLVALFSLSSCSLYSFFGSSSSSQSPLSSFASATDESQTTENPGSETSVTDETGSESSSENQASSDNATSISEGGSASSSIVSFDESYSYDAPTDSSLLVSVLEMSYRYGDATLFTYTYSDSSGEEKNYDILIDAGTKDYNDSTNGTSAQLSALLKEQISDHVLDMVVLSHQHSDHYGGFDNGAIQNGGITEVGAVVDNGVMNYGSSYRSIWENGVRSYWQNKGAEYLPVQNIIADGGSIQIDEGVYLHFLDTGYIPTYGSTGNSDNANLDSVALCLRFGDVAFLCCGDMASSEEESSVMRLHSNSNGTPWFTEGASTVVYKANHHGAVTHGCNSTSYLNWVAPDYGWSSSAIVEANETSGSFSAQHPYEGAYNSIVNAIGNSTTLKDGEVADDRFFWNGTMGTFHWDFSTLESEVSIYGDGRERAVYYGTDGTLVDPAEEKDLPFYKTEFFKRLYPNHS